MVWATCPSHGPIQDASEIRRGGDLERLVCKCGLTCESFEPEPFIEHDELKDLARQSKQPREASGPDA